MATNPLLTELNNLSPAAKTALLQAHGQSANAATAQPAPAPPTLIKDPSAQPQVPPLVAGGQSKIPAQRPEPAPLLDPSNAKSKITPLLAQSSRINAAGPGSMPASIEPPSKITPYAVQAAQINAAGPGQMPKSLFTSSAPPPALRPLDLPQVVAPIGTLAGNQRELAREEQTGSGISQIHSKVASLFPNHPLLGKALGWAAQIPATLADTATSAVAPEIAVNLPGTEYNHERLIKQQEQRLGQAVANAEGQAKTGLETAQGQEAQARIPLETAQGQLAQAQADLIKQGKGWKVEFSPGGEPLQVTNGVQSYLSGAPGIPAEAQQVLNSATQNYQSKQDQDLQKQQKPLSKEQAGALNAAWDGIAKQYHLPTGQFREGMPSADAAQIASSFNNVIGRGQGQQRITVQAGNTGSARADKSFQYNNGELDKLSTPISGLTQRMSTLQTNLAQGTPQADALVAPELLSVMAGGQGSGLRMNEAEISRIVGGRSAWENLKAAAQHWSTDPKSANSITPEQRQQIRALANAVNQKLQAKQQILDNAYEDLLNTDDPKEQRRIVADARQQFNGIDSEQGAKPGYISVQIPGHPPGQIPEDRKDEFLKKNPTAKVL